MELCTTQSISNLPKIFAANPSLLRSKTSVAFRQAQFPRSIQGFLSVARAIEETSTFATGERDSAVAVEVESPSEKKVYNESISTEPLPKEDSPVDEQVNDFLANLNFKFDSEDTYSILLYGGGAIVAVWLASAVVGAIDSIPLFPKLLEVVGLGYTFWFTSRYLLFKKNRDELVAKIEELKQEVFGPSDD
ncbi:protein CURVATURE THYLAKOID 1D, chloroplastic isoform X2 [Jatropha curcas]|uniref:protein CURVATURE THYLAKOID 1D, chloroplastic isoform X2 n=1 Tax=Jatropha curcas TaxID=180498 RepID=UPI0005FB7357|nr:protein CURVATURE THYLAKOID 1D, chloroplastic isoform X2 [Jatropha curcas]